MKKGTIWMSLGILMILAALVLTGYNLMDEKRAENAAADIISQMEEMNDSQAEDVAGDLEDGSDKDDSGDEPKYKIYPGMEMPTVEIDGRHYIGVLEIPVLELKLPVMDEWSYPNLRIAPCRYKGSIYSEDLIVAAHNYSRHFGQLKNLDAGTEVIFTDADGNTFSYVVAFTETLGKTDVEEMEAGEWDLTLFTCTYGGQTRVTVRCIKTA